MRNILYVMLMLVLGYSQGDWGHQVVGYGSVEFKSIDTDNQNNIFLLCDFTDSIDFQGQRFVSAGDRDVLLLKLDHSGQIMNSRQLGYKYQDRARFLSVVNDTTLQLCLTFEDTLYFSEQTNPFLANLSGLQTFRPIDYLYVFLNENLEFPDTQVYAQPLKDGNAIYGFNSHYLNEGVGQALADSVNVLVGAVVGSSRYLVDPVISLLDTLDNRGYRDGILLFDRTARRVGLKRVIQLGGSGYDEFHSVSSRRDNIFNLAFTFEDSVAYSSDSSFTHLAVGNIDCGISEMNENGVLSWSKTFGGKANDHLIKVRSSGNQVRGIGYTLSDTLTINGIDFDMGGGTTGFVVNYDTSGQFQQLHHVISDGFSSIADFELDAAKQHYYYMIDFSDTTTFLGQTFNATDQEQKVLIIKTDLNDNVIWSKTFDGNSYEYGMQLTIDNNDDVIAVINYGGTFDLNGNLFGSNGLSNLIIKLNGSDGTVEVEELIGGPDPMKIYPNPGADLLNIELESSVFQYKVTDISGKLVRKGTAVERTSLDVSNFDRGIYLISLKSEHGQYHRRWLKQ